MKRKILSVLFALVLACSLSLVTAVPMAETVHASPDTWYVDGTLGTDNTTQGTGAGADAFRTIGYAIADTRVGDGDTISVAAGTYTENVVVDKAVTLQGATGATVAPTSGIAVEIQASSVTVDGLTITPLGTVVDAAQGITITATGSGVTISNNTITTVGVGGHGIYVPMSATGLTVTNNNITVGAVATAFYADGGASLSAKNSGWTISGNTLEASDASGGVNMELYDVDAVTIDNNTFKSVRNSNVIVSSEVFDLTGPIVFTNNDVQGNTGGSMVAFITDFQTADDTTMDDVTITGNTFNGWALRGLRIGKDVTGVTVNRNLFMKTGATVEALQWENDAAVDLDAQYNWWGGVAGPVHAKNPYNTQATTQQNGASDNTSTGTIDFTPWMIHTSLASGWNIYSTPIAPDASSNTIAKALDLWTTDTGSYTIGWYFNGATQAWVLVTSTTPLRPMQAVYLNMSANATIDVVLSAEYTSPPQVVMGAGWNLIGPAALEPMHVDVALLSAKFGAGAPDLWGYSQAHSPALHQTLWTFQRGDADGLPSLIPTEGYWVHMVNQGLLAGFTSTPITEVP